MAVLFGWTTEVRWIILLIDGKWTGFGHFEASASTWTRNWVACGSQRMQRRSQCGCFQNETQPSSSRGCPVTCHTSSGMLLPFFKHQKKNNKKRRGSSKMEGGKKCSRAPIDDIFMPPSCVHFIFFLKNFKVSSSSCLSIQQNCSHCPTASSTSFQISGGDVIFRPCQLIEWERRRLSFYTLWKSLKIGKSAREILFTINFRNMSG